MAKKIKNQANILQVWHEWTEESPRGVILTSSAYLEDSLGRLIGAYLVDNAGAKKMLDGFNAPFGSFSSRIAGAYALGLINEREYRMYETLREIRNDFAHNIGIRLDDQSVASRITNLVRLFFESAKWEPKKENLVHELLVNLRAVLLSLLMSAAERSGEADRIRLKQIRWELPIEDEALSS